GWSSMERRTPWRSGTGSRLTSSAPARARCAGGCLAAPSSSGAARGADPLRVDEILEPYRLAAVPVAVTSAVTGRGVDVLGEAVYGRLVAFIGPSGAGEASALYELPPPP